MDTITNLFTDIFWATAQNIATIIMPIITLIIIMKLVHYFIIKLPTEGD